MGWSSWIDGWVDGWIDGWVGVVGSMDGLMSG